MDRNNVSHLVGLAKSDASAFEALRESPEQIIPDFAGRARKIGLAMVSVSSESATASLLHAGFHNACRSTSCGCGGSIIFPPAQA